MDAACNGTLRDLDHSIADPFVRSFAARYSKIGNTTHFAKPSLKKMRRDEPQRRDASAEASGDIESCEDACCDGQDASAEAPWDWKAALVARHSA